MAYKPSKAVQETAIGEGLAIGCTAIGVEAVTSNKLAYELAFARAWRDWPSAGHFPQVRADLSRNSIMRILHDSAGRRGAFHAHWEQEGRVWVPVLRQEWTLEELGEGAGRPFNLGLPQWSDLAGKFTAELPASEG